MFIPLFLVKLFFYIFYIVICINYPPHRTCIVNVSNTVTVLFVARFHSVNHENFIDVFCSKNFFFDWNFKLKVADLMKTLKPRRWLLSVDITVDFEQILLIFSSSLLQTLQIYLLNLANNCGGKYMYFKTVFINSKTFFITHFEFIFEIRDNCFSGSILVY